MMGSGASTLLDLEAAWLAVQVAPLPGQVVVGWEIIQGGLSCNGLLWVILLLVSGLHPAGVCLVSVSTCPSLSMP